VPYFKIIQNENYANSLFMGQSLFKIMRAQYREEIYWINLRPRDGHLE